MGIRLRPRDPSQYQVGNAIIYGGGTKFYHGFAEGEVSTQAEVFYVESDFGNHMTMLWPEIEAMWIVVGWQDYEEWRSNRDELRGKPNLIERQTEEANSIREAEPRT